MCCGIVVVLFSDKEEEDLKRYFLAFILISIIISGCASKEVKSKKEIDTAKQTPVQETISVEKKEMEESEPSLAQEKETEAIELPSSESLIAMSVEEMIDLPVGRLTKDFTVEQETSMWASREVPAQIRSEFLEEIGSFLQNEKDLQVIHEVLIAYLGGSQYKNLVEPLFTYSPTFKEPLLPEPYEVNDGGTKEEAPTNAIILLDASSSMLLPTEGRLKMDVAKSAVSSFAQTMGQKSDVSLYAYGHKGTQEDRDKELSCTGIEEVYPLGKYNDDAFEKTLDKVFAKGWTPLAGAIAAARKDHEATNEDITLYIVSDGEETCGGDPVAEAKKFAQEHPVGKVNVIGFQVDNKAESQLKAVAKAGNGSYLSANTLEEMTGQMTKIWLPSDLDLVSLIYQKPIGWPHTMARDKVHKYHEKIKDAIRVENLRISGAVALLKKEELIDEQQQAELETLVEEKAKSYRRLIEEQANEKLDLVDSEVDRIVKKIDDYQERMNELKSKK